MHFWFEIPFFFGVYIFILSSSFQGDKFSPFSPLKDRKAIIVVASVLEHFVDQEPKPRAFKNCLPFLTLRYKAKKIMSR